MNDEQFWLYGAVDPATNHILHIRLNPRRMTGITEMFLSELMQKYAGNDIELLVDGAPWLPMARSPHGLRFRRDTHGDRNVVKRVYCEVKWRMSPLQNSFSHAHPETVENWLLAHVRWHNSLN